MSQRVMRCMKPLQMIIVSEPSSDKLEGGEREVNFEFRKDRYMHR